MDKPLTPETQSQIRALCESIAQRDQLGEDVQEELRGHIEDKVLAYLDGKEVVTEADAFILASKHFGDSAAVKSMLQMAHPVRVASGIGRRLVVVILATLAMQEIGSRAVSGITQIAGFRSQTVFLILISFHTLAMPLLLYWALRKVSDGSLSGNADRDATKPPNIIILTAVAGLALYALLLGLRVSIPGVEAHLWILQGQFSMLIAVLSFSSTVAYCLVWVWWCNRQQPYTLANVRIAAVSYVLAQLLYSLPEEVGSIKRGEFLFGLPLQLLLGLGAVCAYAIGRYHVRKAGRHAT